MKEKKYIVTIAVEVFAKSDEEALAKSEVVLKNALEVAGAYNPEVESVIERENRRMTDCYLSSDELEEIESTCDCMRDVEDYFENREQEQFRDAVIKYYSNEENAKAAAELLVKEFHEYDIEGDVQTVNQFIDINDKYTSCNVIYFATIKDGKCIGTTIEISNDEYGLSETFDTAYQVHNQSISPELVTKLL